MKKALFFDIDGTLMDFNNYIPESTKEAISLLHQNGHLTFICSGRTRAYINNPELLSMGFDGIISGCSTAVEYKNDLIYLRNIDKELAIYTVETVKKYGFRPILEGWDYIYMDMADFASDTYGRKVIRDTGDHLLEIMNHWGEWKFSKLSCATDHADRENCFRALEKYYDFLIHNEAVAEIVPKGFHKGVGLEMVCNMLGIDISDTYAFGDGANDLGMFSVAGTAVAMGNGSDAAKKAAGYVTDPLLCNGIRNACRHFDLI